MSILRLAAAVVFLSQAQGQRDVTLPSGKSQREEILKADYRKSLHDVDRIVTLAEELKSELEKGDYHVLSLDSLKKSDEIEKLAHRIKTRLRRF